MKATNIEHFESVEDLAQALARPAKGSGWERRASHRVDFNGWAGTIDFPSALKLAQEGWPEGLDKLTKTMLVLSSGKAKTRINDVAGDLPNIGRYLAGQPDCMSRRVIDNSKRKPIVEIIVNASYSCSIKANTIMNFGAAIASAVDDLENVGYSVILRCAAITCTNDNIESGFSVMLKRSNEAMDMGRLVFFLAHPSFLRRIAFCQWETICTSRQLGGGYGHICNMRDIPEGVIYFGAESSSLNDKCSNALSAKDYVKRIIKAVRPDVLPDDEQAA